MESNSYPAFALRLRASCIDAAVFVVLFFSMLYLVSKIQIDNNVLRIALMFAPAFLMEPLMVWLTSGSIGHHLCGIKVASNRTDGRLGVLQSLLRSIVKFVLGLYSFLAMLITMKHRALHDVLSNSVVLFKNESSVSEHHKLQPRSDYANKKPGIVRRVIVIGVWSFLALMLTNLVAFLTTSPGCFINAECTRSEENIVSVVALLFIVLVLLVLILGIVCKLPGAYFSKRMANTETSE